MRISKQFAVLASATAVFALSLPHGMAQQVPPPVRLSHIVFGLEKENDNGVFRGRYNVNVSQDDGHTGAAFAALAEYLGVPLEKARSLAQYSGEGIGIDGSTLVGPSFTAGRGNEHGGKLKFGQGAGWHLCRILKAGQRSESCGSSFGSDIFEGQNVTGRMGFYFSVKTPELKFPDAYGRCWIDIELVAMMVRDDDKYHSCAPNNDRVFDCQGKTCQHGPGVGKL